MKRIAAVTVLLLSFPASASGAPGLIPPVDGSLERSFLAPEHAWGSGHRGIDFAVAAGTAVRAAGSGTVAFAGAVAGAAAVTIDHGGGVETTYSFLSDVLTQEGARVEAGTWIGRAGEAHPGAGRGLHFGVKVEGAYVDPATMLGPLDAGDAVALVPVVPDGVRSPLDERAGGRLPLGMLPGPCRDRGDLARAPAPPNDNVAVAVAGIGSHTQGGLGAAIYEHGPELLGYSEPHLYRFSYRGTAGPDLHESYSKQDTYGDLLVAAHRLKDLLREVARRHPGRKVDLIAHSQGGVVARAYLQLVAEEWDRRLPQVEHLVTFASPHEGAPLAGSAVDLVDGTLIGRGLLTALSTVVDALPRPDSTAVRQLAPGSALLEGMARESLPFGTRSLTLAIPHDVVVPADRTDLDGSQPVVVSPQGLNGHSAIVTSTEARALVYSFLAGGAEACAGAWDRWGPRLGRVVSAAEGALPALVRGLEAGLLGPLAGLRRR